MKILKKLLNRSSDDDDDDEDFDADDGEGMDDAAKTQVIMDGDDDEFGDQPSVADDHFGMGSQLNDDDDDGPIKMGGDTHSVEVDNSENRDDGDHGEFDDDIDFDDDEDDDDEEGARGGLLSRLGGRKVAFIAAGLGVLMLGIIGGGAFWIFGGESEQAAVPPPPDIGNGVQMALPPRSGSLNAIGADNQDRPAETPAPQAETGAQPSETHAGETQPADAQPGGQAAAPSTAANHISSAATLGQTSLNALAGGGAAGQGLVIPAVTLASYQQVPDQPRPTPLATAPDRRLLEQVQGIAKPLPIASKDGSRKPWEVYARPLTGNEQGQRVGVLVTGLGLSRAATMAAITKLPGEVSLVFEPYAKDLDDWLLRARLAGHEVFVALPMESAEFPAQDPGPLGLSTAIQAADNMRRLYGVLSSFAGYVGVVSTMGSKFSSAEGQLTPVLTELKKRGLMFVDGGVLARSAAPRIAAEIDLPRAKSNLFLDDPPSPSNISRRLRQLEGMIKNSATAIATMRAYPSSIGTVAEWAGTLKDKQLALVPVSAIANKQIIK